MKKLLLLLLIHGCHADAGLDELSKAYSAKNPKPKVIEKAVTKTVKVPGPTKTITKTIEKPVYIDRPVIVEKQVLVPQTRIDVHLEPGEGVAIQHGKAYVQRKFFSLKEDDALAELEQQRINDELARRKRFGL
jgi:hypothetical protein